MIDDILEKLCDRVNIPDFKNPEHIYILSEVMISMGLHDIKDSVIQHLIEASNEDELDPDGYTYLGRVYYKNSELISPTEAKPNAKKYKKVGDNYVEIKDDEVVGSKSKSKNKSKTKTGSNAINGTNGQTNDDNGESGDKETTVKTGLTGIAYDSIVADEDKTKKELFGNKDVSDSTDDKTIKKKTTTKDKKIPENKSELLKIDHDAADSQLTLTKTAAKEQAKDKTKKDVGAGTPESRAGETMVHKGLRMLQEGKTFDEIEKYFTKLVNSDDHILNDKNKKGKGWIKSALASLSRINIIIGIDNIEDISWDTSSGRTAIGVDEKLETSSDMFVRTKDGKVIGISMKKDGKVMIANGGWAKQSELLLNELKSTLSDDIYRKISDAISIDTFNNDLRTRISETTKTITPSILENSFDRLLLNPDDQKDFLGSNRDTYFKILEEPVALLKKLEMGTASALEVKTYAKLLKTYHGDEYNHARNADKGLTGRLFDVLRDSKESADAMNKFIIHSLHIPDILGFNKKLKKGGVDEFLTVYGIEPNGAALNESALVTLFGNEFKQLVQDVRDSKIDVDELEKFLVNKIEINYETSKILFKHESNRKYPLFELNGRSKAVGAAPTMEIVQTPFMAHALKMGTFNSDEWDKASQKKFKEDLYIYTDIDNIDDDADV